LLLLLASLQLFVQFWRDDGLWIGKDLKGGCPGLIEVRSRPLPRRPEEIHEKKTAISIWDLRLSQLCLRRIHFLGGGGAV
jgi:hypothetical protein